MHYDIDSSRPTRELHLVMLSPSTSGSNVARADGSCDSRLFFYVNRSHDEVMRNLLAFFSAPTFVKNVKTRGFMVMALEPIRFESVVYDDCTLPDPEDGGVALCFKLEPGVENPTKLIAELGKSLGKGLGVSPYDVMISGGYRQEDPLSYEELNLRDFPADYLDINAVMALSPRVLVAN